MPTPPHCSSAIHICSLAALNDIVEQSSASHVVSVINPWSLPDTPASIAPEHHLKIAINDIEQTQPGLVAPETGHIEQLIEFTQNWDRKRPMVIHCLAGISRSTGGSIHITMHDKFWSCGIRSCQYHPLSLSISIP